MQIKVKKKVLQVIDVFKDYNKFGEHILGLDTNLRSETNLGVEVIKQLYKKLLNEEEIISYSLLVHWLKKNYNFNTGKFGTLEYFLERGWSEVNAIDEINKRLIEIKKRNKLCVEYWLLKGYSEKEGRMKIFDIQSDASKKVKNRSIPPSKVSMINKGFSDEEIDTYMKNKSQLSIIYWVNKGFTTDEAKEKISEIQKVNSNKYVIAKINNPTTYTATTTSQYGYWEHKGYSHDEAKELVSKRQTTFSKNICIEKYGKEEGLRVFTERQKKWNTSLSSGGNLKIGYSKISQELFYNLLESYDIKEKERIYFATHNKEFKLNKIDGGVWLYDFTDTVSKKIIEYHGDYYHGNPNKYSSSDYPHPFRKDITAQEMWDKDHKKKSIANQSGYEVLVIWDSEYRWGNKEEVINKCLKFLNK